MKRLYVGLLGFLLTATTCGAMVTAEEQTLKLAARATYEQLGLLLEQVEKYVNQKNVKDREQIKFQLNLLLKSTSADVNRVESCSIKDLTSMLSAAEFITANFKTNVPAHITQICTNQPDANTDAQKTLNAAELLERYQKLEKELDELIKKVTELNMTRVERFLNQTDSLYTGNKEWLEPVVAATTLGLLLWKSREIKPFVEKHWAACSMAVALAYYLRGQKRTTIAGLKSKLPAAVYYPLAFCKWMVGSHEKALRVTLPYGTDINISEVRAWVSRQEKLCGQPIAFDEDKVIAPFGFGSLAKLIGMKNDVAAPLSFTLGGDGSVKGNMFFLF